MEDSKGSSWSNMSASWTTMDKATTSASISLVKTKKQTAIPNHNMDGDNKALIPLLAAPPVVSSACSSVSGDSTTAVGETKLPRKKGGRSSTTPDDRLQRCRERNRIHARKTRLRKKEHMQSLQQRADGLKRDQLRLKQIINEKNTASILVGFAASKTEGGDGSKEDPRVEALMRRPAEEIPDSTKIPELPALILPGQHASKKAKAESDALKLKSSDEMPNDGFDYELLGKDRSKCTPEELDQIRRERNRMHAKRTRDRKRLFMEEMSEICRQLEEENDVLRAHLKSIDPDFTEESESTDATDVATPIAPLAPSSSKKQGPSASKRKDVSSSPTAAPSKRQKLSATGNQLQYLLDAARSFETTPKATDTTSSALLAVVNKAMNEATPTTVQV